jgi:hypothetical protein
MHVDVAEEPRGFRYTVRAEEGDPRRAERQFTSITERDVELVGHEYRVELPEAFSGIHPDVHAYAIWLALRPFVARSLTLPFAVSEPFATVMQRGPGVTLTRVDPALAPRTPPPEPRSALLFSGGTDSVAVAFVEPEGVPLLFLDRIAEVTPAQRAAGELIDLAPQRAVCDRLREQGRTVHQTRDDHERLFAPYPIWHSEMSTLVGLYMADSLGLHYLDTGDVLDVFAFRGYHQGELARYAFEPLRAASEWGPIDAQAFAAGPATADVRGNLPVLGLRMAGSAVGLSEVCTATIVHRTPLRRQAFSCYFDEGRSYCLRCDKCFKKLLLDHVVGDEDVPPELFESFLRQRHLAAIFARPYFDWHHVWYYLFQKMRCDHWFVRALQEQARQGPDLALLGRWYPPAADAIPEPLREAIVANIARFVDPMSDDEVRQLESLVVPPLVAPPLPAGWFEEPARSPGPAHAAATSAAPGAALTSGDPPRGLRVVFRDRLGRYPDLTFFVAPGAEGAPAFRRIGALRLLHAPCRPGKVFGMCGDALVAAMHLAGALPDADTLPRWRAAVTAAVARTPLPRRFDVETALAPLP